MSSLNVLHQKCNAKIGLLGPLPQPRYSRACVAAPVSPDVSEIKFVFSSPPHRLYSKLRAQLDAAPTDQLPIVRFDPGAGERSLGLARWGSCALLGQGHQSGVREDQCQG
jgi:hypothetical protein